MKSFNKAIVAPIVAVLAMMLQLVFGVEIPEVMQEELTSSIVNLGIVLTALYGVFKNYKK